MSNGYQVDWASLYGAPQSGGLAELMKLIGGPVGAVNPLASLGMNLGGKLISGLGSLIGGPSQSQKSAKEVYNLARNRLGQNVLDPNQYMASFTQAMAPRFNQQAEGINRRLGLDSGVAQAELGSAQQAPLAQFYLDTGVKNDQLKAQFDNQLLSLMGDLSHYM